MALTLAKKPGLPDVAPDPAFAAAIALAMTPADLAIASTCAALAA